MAFGAAAAGLGLRATAFAEAVSATLVRLGYSPQRVKIERFGGTEGR